MDTPTNVLERVGFPRSRHYTKVILLCRSRFLSSLQTRRLTASCLNRVTKPAATFMDTNQPFMQVRMLSGGECRRLQLAAVLMARPNLLILDEVGPPTCLSSSMSSLIYILGVCCNVRLYAS